MQYRARINTLSQTHSSNTAFTNQWGLNKINADAAWAKLQLKSGLNTAPGTGVTLGAIDSGIDASHPVFAGKTVNEVFLLGATDEDGSSRSHGTSVASVMVGAPDQDFITKTTGTRGVAWGADITMFALPTGAAGGGNYVPASLSTLNSRNNAAGWPAVINQATGWSSGGRTLDFVNVSIGWIGMIDFYSSSDLTANLGNMINAIRQSGSNRTVFVWSAGNSHNDPCSANDFPSGHQNLCSGGRVNAASPEILAGLPARIPELRSNHIAVVAIGSSGSIASFSNRCGIAADWCIAAPGVNIRTAFFGPHGGNDGQRGSVSYQGTSFAAPFVTGGLGVMKHFFRNQLSNTALVSRLYATADKSGIYASKSIYGQGLMDLDAAVSPVGFTYVALGEQVADGGMPLDGTALSLAPAFGDQLSLSLAELEFAAFDQLGAPFWHSLGGFADSRSGPSVQSRLAKFMVASGGRREFGIFRPVLGAFPATGPERLSLGLMEAPAMVDDGGHLSLLGPAVALSRPLSQRLGFSLFSNQHSGSRATVTGLEFVSRSAKLPVAFRSGIVAERQTLLSSSAAGAFGRMSGSSAFIGIDGSVQAGPWLLSAGAELGAVRAGIDDSLLSISSPLATSAFAVRAGTRVNARDTLEFALSQPLRIESGRAKYAIPVGRTVDGDVLRASGSVDLEPSARQIDLHAQWHRTLPAGHGDFRLSTGVSFHPGHRATAEPEFSVLAGWRLGF